MKNKAQLAQELFDLETDGSCEENANKMAAVIGHLGPTELQEVMAVVKAMTEEQVAKYKLDAKRALRDMALFDGLPETTTFFEAASIKAKAGDPYARGALAQMNSRPHRLHIALFAAAAKLHPGWQTMPDGHSWRKLDKNAPDENALIEWFQINYPLKARAVENAL